MSSFSNKWPQFLREHKLERILGFTTCEEDLSKMHVLFVLIQERVMAPFTDNVMRVMCGTRVFALFQHQRVSWTRT